ncbi:MAG TPA: TlpA disulfide reductase family protein [Hymenobacter sp.]|jgi:peroxiredoxin|uniref:TlpA disulfide reductase family protein n=1 Tax=Hymenobacter sp. TaxID=1898978 RepID=UPI002EDB6C22
MKNQLLGLLLLAPGLALAQTPVSYTIKGKIGQLNAPAKVYLLRGMQPSDSATLKNGAFEFKGSTDVPAPADVVLQRNGKLKDTYSASQERVRIFLEPTPVVISSADSLLETRAKVSGGSITADNQKLGAAMLAMKAKAMAFGAEARKATEAQRKDPVFAARMQAQFEALNKEYGQVYVNFIRENPNSWVSLYGLEGMQMMEVPQYAVVGPLYNALSPTLKNSPVGRRYGELVEKLRAVALGAQAPAFTQKTPDGKPVSLADYRGKYVLVDFWASWCGPCRKENPAVIKLYNEFKGKNFDVLGVSLDDEKGRAKWAKAIADDHLPWTQVSDLRGFNNEAAQLYGVRAIPQNFLIDPAGKIVALNLKGEELRAALAKYLK